MAKIAALCACRAVQARSPFKGFYRNVDLTVLAARHVAEYHEWQLQCLLLRECCLSLETKCLPFDPIGPHHLGDVRWSVLHFRLMNWFFV